eukprot:CAMPEP_0172760626 /NCGR_PEP_ID=MMETSP1074-20121228/169956_1 /TAXON_ID=2916 /ORGANISM="Ceratium fusus, Strain PA161109" /LENGTH=32 /DNA_ID= /DNA_START= /DNA_END= /DNA_ORIENTATION=
MKGCLWMIGIAAVNEESALLPIFVEEQQHGRV